MVNIYDFHNTDKRSIFLRSSMKFLFCLLFLEMPLLPLVIHHPVGVKFGLNCRAWFVGYNCETMILMRIANDSRRWINKLEKRNTLNCWFWCVATFPLWFCSIITLSFYVFWCFSDQPLTLEQITLVIYYSLRWIIIIGNSDRWNNWILNLTSTFSWENWYCHR